MSDFDDLADYRWLTGEEAAGWLAQLVGSDKPVHTWAARLRREFSAARTHLLLEQVDLRHRATAKYAAAHRMFFTRRLLEQATDQWTAEYKASRFADSNDTADFCCGIGGDLLTLVTRGAVTAIDRDPIAIHLAQANVAAVCDRTAANRVVWKLCDVSRWGLSERTAWHLDPDRRIRGSRSSQLEFGSPSVSVIEALLAVAPNAAIKLAPAALVPDDWTDRCELEWISCRGQCKQQVAWHGELGQATGRRRATILRPCIPACGPEKKVAATVTGKPCQPAAVAAQLGRYLYEPEPAVLAAKLTGELAAMHNLRTVASGSAYLTADEVVTDACLSRFEVQDVLAFDRRALRRYFAARNIGRLAIKKRGIDLDPARLRRGLRLRGEDSATLIVTRIGEDIRAVVAQRA